MHQAEGVCASADSADHTRSEQGGHEHRADPQALSGGEARRAADGAELEAEC
ncbi:hypothetical protein GCM10025866_11930 [Naasia aerilata]|uniref:Uncharacterized protein n=1 Tax=Naasia aerilata TaxID=1162966 RepID=A0ABN6XK98_9MICO|nr:hypothetical protein GCM10025866_11930 [Naasia aerilata]